MIHPRQGIRYIVYGVIQFLTDSSGHEVLVKIFVLERIFQYWNSGHFVKNLESQRFAASSQSIRGFNTTNPNQLSIFKIQKNLSFYTVEFFLYFLVASAIPWWFTTVTPRVFCLIDCQNQSPWEKAEFREISKFSFTSRNFHFWMKITVSACKWKFFGIQSNYSKRSAMIQDPVILVIFCDTSFFWMFESKL